MIKNRETKMNCAVRLTVLIFLTLLSACSDRMTVQFEKAEQTVQKTEAGGVINVHLERSSRRSIDLPFLPTTHTSDEVLIPYTVTGTSTPGVNHNLSNGVLRVPAGVSSETLSFRIMDGSFAGTKTLVVNLSAPEGVQLGEKISHTVYIGDQAELKPFISTWNTDPNGSGEKSISLPLEEDGSYDFSVNWGDGTENRIKSWNDPNATHTYDSSGVYTLTITGTIVGFKFNNGEQEKISNISQFGSLRLGNNGAYFLGASNLTVTATDPLNLTGTTDLNNAFNSCSSLTTVPSMISWDTSQVTNMMNMFNFTPNFNQDISNWNTSNVTNMGGMFSVSVFNQPIGTWNTSNVTNMSGMFSNSVFNQPIGNWNTSNVTNMSMMFQDSVFNQPIGNWNTSNVTNMSGMFQSSVFNQPIGSWNTSNVTNMSGMFSNSVFNQPIGNWDTSKVTDMSSLFNSNSGFNQNISNWDTSNVTDMRSMFQNASQFNQNINNWNTGNVTNMGGMFSGATQFDQNIGGWNIQSVVYNLVGGFFAMFDQAGLSTSNYDALLIGWSSQNVQPGLRFDAGSSKYSPAAAAARAHLINDMGWTIYDGGPQ